MSSAPLSSETRALTCELATEVLVSSGRLRLQVTGWSMLPTIWPGDTLLIDRAAAHEVCAGDIVLYNRNRGFVVHRVLAAPECDQKAGTLLTRGDAMPAPDPPLADSDLLGKVSFILRDGRCIEPRRTLRISERAVAALVRSSHFAARVVVGIHGMHPSSSVQASPIQVSNGQVVPCQR